MNVLSKFLPEIEMLISKIGQMKQEPQEEMQEPMQKPMQERAMPPEEDMGALKDIA